jgi:nucleoside-diphosphate-sugar epimerase
MSKAAIASEAELEDLLAEPNEQDIEALRKINGDILILGVGGKMGPTLAARAIRALRAAASKRDVIGVSRFSSSDLRASLNAAGVKTVSADLLRPEQVGALPNAENVIYMAARKFGTSGEESLTWATNAFLPGLVADRFRNSNIVSWSTGNVYPLTPISSGGPIEESPLAPAGEYAQSALARERIFEYFSRTCGSRVSILRLNYAVEMRYGVLVDIAMKVHQRRPVDLTMGYVNVIWQGDANSVCLRSLAHCSSPPFVVNVTSPEAYAVRWIAESFARMFNTEPVFTGSESESALLSNAAKCREYFGPPRVTVEQMMDWIADWIMRDGVIWNKPTHFEVRDGKF